MIEALKARWRRLTPEQRMAIGIGVPAAAGFALWQRQKAAAEPDKTVTVATETDEGAAVSTIGTGVDAGAIGELTGAWNEALAGVAGQIEEVASTAQGAADAAAAAQAAAEAAQAAADAAAADSGGTGTGTGGGGSTAGGGRNPYGARYANLAVQKRTLTRRIATLRALIAIKPPGPARRRLRAELQRAVARRRQIIAEMAAIRAAHARGGGPTTFPAMAYAPGLVVAGASMGAESSVLSSSIPTATYTPPATRRAGSLFR